MGTKRFIIETKEARKKLTELISEAQQGHRVSIRSRGRPLEVVVVDPRSEYQQRREEFRVRRELLAASREFAGRVRAYMKDAKLRAEASKAVRLNEKRLRCLLEGASEAVLETDTDGSILQVNRAAEKMFGYERSELLHSTIDQLVPAAVRNLHMQHRADYMRNPHARPMGMGMELTAQKKSGSVFPVEVGLSSYRLNGSLRVIVLVHDVTQRKQMEDAIRRSEDRLRQAEKLEALARMAGGTAHEFNNLLTMVMGYSALMLSSLDSKETLIDYVEKISQASRRAAELTRQLQAFSGHKMLAPQTVDLNMVLSEIREILPSLIGHSIDASLIPAPEPALVRADPSQLHQVIINLIFNARDAMPDGGKLTMEISNIEMESKDVHESSGLTPGQYVKLRVSDTGVGLAREVQSRIFEPFFTTKEFGKGSGLNLAAIYGIVQQSRGSISVNSEPGVGTTFTILLPQATQEEDSVGKSDATETPVPRGNETILLVEDEESLRTLTSEFLESLGYRVLVASEGQEALRTAECTGRIDLLLTDVLMPGMSGRELAQELSPLRPEIKVLYVSGYIDNLLAQEGVTKPNESFLEKPFAFEHLAEKIRAVLGGM